MESSAISWCDHTFNPWLDCVQVSAGCRHCYAETLVTGRMGRPELWGPAATTPRQRTSLANWQQPERWQRRVQATGGRPRAFCASLADVFEPHPQLVPLRQALWDLIRRCPDLDWQLLTKRPAHILSLLLPDWSEGWPHVWLGVSIEDRRVAHRAELLKAVPARVRFVSYEPALGPLDDLPLDGLHWVIYGGESGPRHRLDDVQWVRTMRVQCQAAGVAFWFKQRAHRFPGRGVTLDGALVQEWPPTALPRLRFRQPLLL